ncbi:hypothetical protein [uncultured Treponema sp.]|uniref:hypothetical protein n=1 Tax=uncultured Treponema sp. TaxID=162155 RepID=UPI0025F84178|nr:hypothetical protein [uncultured Treponema sp.]
MKKYFALVLSVFAFQFSVFARGAQELVESGHWIYDSLTAISLEAGILNFSGTAPVTVKQIQLYLDEIDYDSLSESARADYDRIERYLAEEPLKIVNSDILFVGFEPSLNFSGFYKTNDDLEWVYDRYNREPMIDLPATIGCGDYVTMKMDVILAQNKGASLRNDNYTNILYSPDDFDINFPDNGYFSSGLMFTEKTGLGFQIGKGCRSVGRTLTGSMIWSDYLTGVSYAQLELYSPSFKYTGGISQFNVDKYMYHHQLDARFFKKFQITFVEGLLVNAPMELRYMNPWMIFHGIAAWREYEPEESDPESHTCDYFGINLQFTPVKYSRFYGTFAMTQYQTPYETSNYGDSPTPNGLGAQLGNETYVPHGRGRWHFALEGSWADPYLYIKESPNWSMVRTYSENMGDKAIFYEWIGSPFGPDTISCTLSAGYEVSEKWSVDFIYLYMARGEQSGTNVFKKLNKDKHRWGGQKTAFDMNPNWYDKDGNRIDNEYLKNWAYPDNENQSNWEELRDAFSPSGTPEFVNRLSVRGIWQATEAIKFTVQPSFVAIFNHNNQQGEKAFGFEVAAALNINLLKF